MIIKHDVISQRTGCQSDTIVESDSLTSYVKRGDTMKCWNDQEKEINSWIDKNIICDDAIFSKRISYSHFQKYDNALPNMVWVVDVINKGKQLMLKF